MTGWKPELGASFRTRRQSPAMLRTLRQEMLNSLKKEIRDCDQSPQHLAKLCAPSGLLFDTIRKDLAVFINNALKRPRDYHGCYVVVWIAGKNLKNEFPSQFRLFDG